MAAFIIKHLIFIPLLIMVAAALALAAMAMVPVLLVAAFFWLLMSLLRYSQFGGTQRQHRQQLFRDTLFALLGAVSCADGDVSRSEIRCCDSIIRRLGLDGDLRQRAIEYFKRGTAADFYLDECLEPFLREFGPMDTMRIMLLSTLVQMAQADNVISPGEQRILQYIAARMGLRMESEGFGRRSHGFGQRGPGGSHRGSRAPSADLQLAQAYQLLGVQQSDSDAAIKRAYRRLMSKYHPDKIAHKGLPPEALSAATDKAQEIQSAYELIKDSRGL